MVMTDVSRFMDAIGVLSLCKDKRDLKAVMTTILSSSSDMLECVRRYVRERAVAQCLVAEGSGVGVTSRYCVKVDSSRRVTQKP